MTILAADESRPDERRLKLSERYRRLLGRPGLTDQEIADMREHVVRLARAICEHVWGRKFY